MPVLDLQIGLERNQTPVSIEAIVDSGADATLIPLTYLQALKATPTQERWLIGVTGTRQLVRLYTVFNQIGSFGLYAPVVGGRDGLEAILGRDVLNQFVVTLDGLSQTVMFQAE